MSAAILQAAGKLLAGGLPTDLLSDALAEELQAEHGAHTEAVIAGEELLDLPRLDRLRAIAAFAARADRL